jgi:hypothetical protein
MENNLLDQQIELFVTGKLSGKELAEFQALLASDTKLKSEVMLQKSIIEGIKKHRITQLKAKLNSVDVSNLSHSTSGVSAFTKYAAATLITASLGIAAYFYFGSKNTTEDIATDANPIEYTLPATEENIVANQNAEKEDVSKVNPNIAKPSKAENKINQSKINKNVTTPKSKTAVPNATLIENIGEKNMDSEIDKDITDVPNGRLANNDITKENDIDIKNVTNQGYKFHYQMKENSLILYGNFDASPYEILEFNSVDGVNLYLYYDNSFFELNRNQHEVTKLKKIKDAKLIEELNSARIKKK